MSYYMKMTGAKFFVPTEYTGRVFAKVENPDYDLILDEEGNITDILFHGEMMMRHKDFSLFQSIAPYVKDGSYIEIMNEESEHSRWVFANGECQEIKGAVIWPEE